MISEVGPEQPERAYVWFWLPGQVEPTRVGRVDQDGPTVSFTYAPDYLAREDVIPVYSELPLRRGEQRPRMSIHGYWEPVCDEAGLNRVQRSGFLGRQFLNPFVFETGRS